MKAKLKNLCKRKRLRMSKEYFNSITNLIMLFLIVILIRLAWHFINDFYIHNLFEKRYLHWITSLDPFHWLIDILPLPYRVPESVTLISHTLEYWFWLVIDQILHVLSIIGSSIFFVSIIVTRLSLK